MSLRRADAVLLSIAAVMFMAGCGSDKKASSGNTAGAGGNANAVATSSASASDTAAKNAPVQLGPVAGVEGVTLGGDCPDPGPGAEAEVLAQASALIPLKVGLTLSHIWRSREGDYDHECLEQVVAIDARSILTTGSCPYKDRKPGTWTRRLCRTDMRES
jgi:hypothetical protein